MYRSISSLSSFFIEKVCFFVRDYQSYMKKSGWEALNFIIIIDIMNNKVAFSLLLLLIALIPSSASSQYSLSPILPPTAFVGQYYTCNFRVSGLATPSFSFQGLPSCFTASSTGSIQGIPNQTGTLSVTIRYEESGWVGQQVVVIRVAEPDYNASSHGSSLNRPNQNLNWITLNVPSTYKVGDKISIKLNQGSNKYTWSYLQLPEMLSGDADGSLNGVFYDEGYYSFGASCSDSTGNSLDYFFLFNIQPLSSKYSAVLAQVPNRNVFKYDYYQLEALQRAAEDNRIKAQKAAEKASQQLGKAKGDVATTASNLKMAQTQALVVQKVVKLALEEKTVQFNKASILQTKRDNAQGQVKLKQKAYDQAVKNTGLIQSLLDAATALFNKMTDILAAINKQFITAQNQSTQAANDLELVQGNVAAATQDLNIAFKEVSEAKKVLQTLNNNKVMIEFNVSSGFDGRDIANFENDAANSAYNTATNNLNKAFQDLQAANSTVFQLQQQAAAAKNSLGQAEFNLTQAMNYLYVAQAAKEQSDKALLLASAQSSQLPSGTSTYIFSGCEIGNYPIISGTAQITNSSSGGFELNSGYKIVYGDCTDRGSVNFSTGDVVSFQGYFRNGFIHGIKLAKE